VGVNNNVAGLARDGFTNRRASVTKNVKTQKKTEMRRGARARCHGKNVNVRLLVYKTGAFNGGSSPADFQGWTASMIAHVLNPRYGPRNLCVWNKV
jgi:hypothetical protein